MTAIGTNALPHLLKWIGPAEGPSRPQRWAVSASERFRILQNIRPLQVWARGLDNPLPYLALSAFSILGSNASPAIPDLIKLTSSQDRLVRRSATTALAAIGPPAYPTLLTFITNQNHSAHIDAITSVPHVRTPSIFTPHLVQCLQETNLLAITAALFVFNRGHDHDMRLVVPAVTNLLLNPPPSFNLAGLTRSMCEVLAASPAEGRLAIPALTRYLKEQPLNGADAVDALQTIMVLSESHATVVPLLADCLSHTNGLLKFSSATALGKFGALSAPALPALTNALQTSTGRLHLVISNSIQQIVSPQSNLK